MKTGRCLGFGCILYGLVMGCGPLDGPSGHLNGEGESEIEETSLLALLFEQSSARYDVPVDLLKALAFVETGFEPATGEVEFEGQSAPFGLFNLRGAQLDRGANLINDSLAEIEQESKAGIEAAAALLSASADELGIATESRSDAEAWLPVLETWADLDDAEMAHEFALDVLRVMASGLAIPIADGSTIVIKRHSMAGRFNVVEQGLSASGAIWRPSPNHSSRNGSRVEAVIIHTCEGAYSGCVSWLRQPRARVSAHYVVKENGREVTQLVDENRKAWHIGARYRSRLNGGRISGRDGQSSNNFTIGIEHGGSARQRSFPPAQIDASVALVRDIVRRHNIPVDRYHIVGHGQLQPESRTDPGPNWPWANYLRRIAQGSSAPNPPTTTPPSNPPSATRSVRNVITVDNSNRARFSASGNWQKSAYASGRVGRDYRYRRPAYKSDTAKYKIPISHAGRYEVFARIPGNGYNSAIPYIIRHRNGQTVVKKNVSDKGAEWLSLGSYLFDAKDDWIFDVSVWTNGSGIIIADAVRFVHR